MFPCCFGAKKDQGTEILGFGRARNETRAKRWKRGVEEGNEGNSVSFLSSPPLPALLLVPFVARSLTLVPRSLLLNHTETLATQATHLFVAVDLQNRKRTWGACAATCHLHSRRYFREKKKCVLQQHVDILQESVKYKRSVSSVFAGMVFLCFISIYLCSGS